MVDWHAITVKKAFELLGSSPSGLSDEEVKQRLRRYGPNEIEVGKRPSAFLMFAKQFANVLIIILLAATLLSMVLGEVLDAMVIIAIVAFVALFGFILEYRSEKALEALKRMAAPKARVLRGGREVEVPAREVVPGDVVVLSMGSKVPADGRLVETINLRLDEAPLTGESVPVDKYTKILPAPTPVADRSNCVFASTTVVYGRGKALVTATGMDTEFGEIAKAVQVKREETPFERKVREIGRWIGVACVLVAALLMLMGIAKGYDPLFMVIWGTALAVAIVPEALPAVLVGTLGVCVLRLAKKNAIIRKLSAVETLGSVQILCVDKTGTLTEGKMTVREIYVYDGRVSVTGVGYDPKDNFLRRGVKIDVKKDHHLMLTLKAGLLCNDSRLVHGKDGWSVVGDPTEGALVVVAMKAGLKQDKLNKELPRENEIPFTSERKRMTTVHSSPEGPIAFMKGAPEVVLNLCEFVQENDKVKRLTKAIKQRVLIENERMAENALRSLAVAYKRLSSTKLDEREEGGFVFLGIFGMIDPPREGVREAVRRCEVAGIKTLMITGDHKSTAVAVASEIGVLKEGDLVLTGEELDAMDEKEYGEVVEKVKVYARVSPFHKVRIANAWKRKGYVVAMTGDGANDAPAIKKSDVGIAMGITGTDVTKEVSDMVLADDNYVTIVGAVEGGRWIFDNMQKYMVFLLSCNLAEVLIVATAFLMGLGLPLLTPHILWINLVTDGFPALALGVEPPVPDVMKRPPRDPKEGPFRAIKKALVTMCILIAFCGLFAFHWYAGEGLLKAQTMTFTTLVMCELWNAVNCKSLKHPVSKVGWFSNKYLLLALAASFALQVIAVHPLLAPYLETVSLKLEDWAFAVLVSSTIFLAIEGMKRTGWFK
jgi:Ca2+-transporting ATPase